MAIEKYVIFRLDRVLFGIHISLVSEIINPPRIFRVPDAPDSVTGLINVRGSLHTVLNLRPVFHLDTCDSIKSRMLLIRRDRVNDCQGNEFVAREWQDNENPDDDCPVGIIVDEVLEIAEIGESDKAEIPANFSLDADTTQKYLKGAAQSKDRFILILNGLRFLD